MQSSPNVQLPSTGRIARAIQRGHFFFFLLAAFTVIQPGELLRPSWYLQALAYSLERAVSGEVNRSVINLPPRYLKSIAAAVALVAWSLGRNPALKIIVATYSQELAEEHAENCRRLMTSVWYRRLFPHTLIDPRNSKRLNFRTTAGGGRRAVSVAGSLTGLGADIIILDDCMKADDISSETVREKLKRWYRGTLLPRLNSKRRGAIISIAQRLGEDDLTALLLDLDAEHLSLPAIAEEETQIPLGFGRVHNRHVGEALDPEREDIAVLEEIRRQQGPYYFAAQYQQNPVAPEGNLFRLDKFPRYPYPMNRDGFTKVVLSLDSGTSAEPDSDYSALTIWGLRDRQWYLIHVLRRQMEYPQLRDTLIDLYRRWRPDRVVIEEDNIGRMLGQELRHSCDLFKPIMWPIGAGKIDRARGQLGQIEDGRIFLPDDAPWLPAFLSEVRSFPYGRNDDQVDSMVQFLDFAMSRKAWVDTEYDPETGRRLHVRRRQTVARR